MVLRIIVATLLLGSTATVVADTIHCEFSAGVINSEDRYQPGGGQGYVRRGWKKAESIDPSRGKKPELALTVKFTPGETSATLAGNNDIVQVTAVFNAWFRSFIEITPGGGVHVLTVAAARNAAGEFLAAYSRHAVLYDTLVVSQYWGTCR